MAPLAPLAPTFSDHPPTQALVEALAANGWMFVSAESVKATLYHPERREEMTLMADPDDPGRIRYASINGLSMVVSTATEYVTHGAIRKRRPPSPLQPRQRQVLRMLATGLSRDQVAERLDVVPKTIDAHVDNARQAARAASVVHLTLLCERNGWLDEVEQQKPGRRRSQSR